jgi:hypothetical protein
MNPLLSRIWRSPRLSRIVLALCLPAMVTIGFAPGWAIGLCLLTIGLSVIFMYAEVLSPKFIQSTGASRMRDLSADSVTAPIAHRLPRENTPEPLKIDRPMAPNNSEAAPELLKAWAEYGHETSSSLSHAQSEIRDAIRMSTSSAIEVGHCVQQVQANHDAQVLLASKLLESTQSGPDQNQTLADLAGVAAEALDHQSKQMALTSENAFYLVERQQMASLIALRVDDLLADADKAARELGMAALASQERTVKMGDELHSEIDPLAFSKTYRNTIRELRTGLDAIRQSLAQATNDLQNNVNQLKGAANLGRAEVDSVARKIHVKLAETRQTMQRLSELSLDTDNHIRSAVVAMQYHDITTQKLAAVEGGRLQVLIAHTQTMVANSFRQFPDISTRPITEHASPAPLAQTAKAPSAEQPRKPTHNELSDQALAELEKHAGFNTPKAVNPQDAMKPSGPHSVDIFE